MITVYSVPLCGGCQALKEYIASKGIGAMAEDLREIDAVTIADMRIDGLHALEDRVQAPVLRVGPHFWRFEDLFVGVGKLDTEAVDRALDGAKPRRFGV